MKNKIIITTSRRPTPVVRRFIKQLTYFIPYAQYQRRGKLTFSLLVLQAIDFDVDKILVVRNRKGNPGYIDVYQVDHVNKLLFKLCTLYICGFSDAKAKNELKLMQKPKQVLILNSTLALIDDENVMECLLTSFNVEVCNEVPMINTKNPNEYVIVDIRKMLKEVNSIKFPVYEVVFKNLRKEVVGPVIRICKAKTYTKAT